MSFSKDGRYLAHPFHYLKRRLIKKKTAAITRIMMNVEMTVLTAMIPMDYSSVRFSVAFVACGRLSGREPGVSGNALILDTVFSTYERTSIPS